MDLFMVEAMAHGLRDFQNAVWRCATKCLAQCVLIIAFADTGNVDRIKAFQASLKGTKCLLQTFGECTANGHGFPYRFHGGGEKGLSAREFLKREARDLGDDIVDGRLKGRRCYAGNVVHQFIKRVAHGKAGCDLGNRETRSLGRQR